MAKDKTSFMVKAQGASYCFHKCIDSETYREVDGKVKKVRRWTLHKYVSQEMQDVTGQTSEDFELYLPLRANRAEVVQCFAQTYSLPL